ncbi:hypothetical protein Pmani_016657 [Petrolisthes manimaculis]|uniref:Uncharacterized protein n=1 Tax=Petrolisthes manimaculis TaxID=1843537 RepID=A0AAE1PPL6_9EUCA|nr:hypothetical protein Pmani_016657 [Petrolisthes manimaculis]
MTSPSFPFPSFPPPDDLSPLPLPIANDLSPLPPLDDLSLLPLLMTSPLFPFPFFPPPDDLSPPLMTLPLACLPGLQVSPSLWLPSTQYWSLPSERCPGDSPLPQLQLTLL